MHRLRSCPPFSKSHEYDNCRARDGHAHIEHWAETSPLLTHLIHACTQVMAVLGRLVERDMPANQAAAFSAMVRLL